MRNPAARVARTRAHAIVATTALVVLAAACAEQRDADAGGTSADAVRRPADVAAEVRPPERMGLGAAATPARVAAIDIDANAAGHGLPPGRGTVAEGAALYAAQCASCHGARGEGQATYPRLVGPATDTTFRFGNDLTLVKTPGNYWPYATTLYDYIHRAMPYGAPGSLEPDQVYALVAYLLAENRVIPRDAVMDARTLPAVRMPARGRFVPDDRRGGAGFR